MPILVSAVIVFVASSTIHMVLPCHRDDLRNGLLYGLLTAGTFGWLWPR